MPAHDLTLRTNGGKITIRPSTWEILPSGALKLYWGGIMGGPGSTRIIAPGYWKDICFSDMLYPVADEMVLPPPELAE